MKTLIIGPSWVGDMVMAQSVFTYLKQQKPDSIIDVLAPAWTEALLKRMPEVNKAIHMPVGHGQLGLGNRHKLGKSLREENYQQAIVLPNSFKSALVPLFAKIPLRTGWRGEARSWLLNDCRVLDENKYPLMVQRFVALGAKADAILPEPLPRPSLSVDDASLAALREKFSIDLTRPVLALCPGAEFGPSKKWPEEYYANVAEAVIQNGQQVWIFGSANDQNAGQAIVQALPAALRAHCKNFTGRTLLGEAIDLMSLASSVVSNDSGLMHIAAALAKPLVVVYGSTSAGFTPPLAEQVKSLSLGLECSPCFKRECPLQHLNCLRDLKPEKVLQALTSLNQ